MPNCNPVRLARSSAAIVLAFIACPNAHAEIPSLKVEPAWTDAKICSAAVKTYFYLDNPPWHSGRAEGWLEFQSDAGNRYKCLPRCGFVELSWEDNQGSPMKSVATTFQIDGGRLSLEVETWREVGVDSTTVYDIAAEPWRGPMDGDDGEESWKTDRDCAGN